MKANHQTIQSLFQDAIRYDEPYTAHLIYFATRKGKVEMQDPAAKLYEMTLTREEQDKIRDMHTADKLGMRTIKLYAIKRNPTNYVFYFASNAWDARELHHQLYGCWENHLISAYNQMIDKGLYFPDRKITRTFRELMKETVVFPRWVCEVGM
ncbi:hypothetical protein [Ureibacillus sinduriensis]|uniref:Uncharacterized protein n=1 Tax=Ureibacillus sinduriensis BLB-1 = JCM 15800 TaxID=1384057 RepID=A0A0A3HY43_9BACL|nr:hypothetical protein [Ureibacillus sinduriensis]KGR76160.1 hypothetical protein CD33_08300 [Ureibacillus sinduriensis BLB-1 = JCM 15800]